MVAVILAIAICARANRRHAVFSSIEKAQAWSDSLSDDWVVILSPYIIDEPDFGKDNRQ